MKRNKIGVGSVARLLPFMPHCYSWGIRTLLDKARMRAVGGVIMQLSGYDGKISTERRRYASRVYLYEHYAQQNFEDLKFHQNFISNSLNHI
jgi:hypothetical protein